MFVLTLYKTKMSAHAPPTKKRQFSVIVSQPLFAKNHSQKYSIFWRFSRFYKIWDRHCCKTPGILRKTIIISKYVFQYVTLMYLTRFDWLITFEAFIKDIFRGFIRKLKIYCTFMGYYILKTCLNCGIKKLRLFSIKNISNYSN